MACENLSKYYPIVRKFSGYPLFNEDTSAVDSGPDRSIRLAVLELRMWHNELDCASVTNHVSRKEIYRVLPLRFVQ